MKLLKFLRNSDYIWISIIGSSMLAVISDFSSRRHSALFSGILNLLSILVVLYIVYKDGNPAYKLAWVVPILAFPIFGGLLYVAMGNKHLRRIS